MAKQPTTATPAPAAAPAPVGDPGSVFDHCFRLAAALRAQQWGEAFRLVVDIFGHLQEPMQAAGGPVPMLAANGPGNVEGLAANLERVAGAAGGQPAMGKGHPQAVGLAIPWAQLMPLLLQALMLIFQRGPAPTPVTPENPNHPPVQ